MKPPIFYRRFDYDPRLLPNPHLATLEADVTNIDAARARTGATIGYPGWGLIYYATLCALDPTTSNVVLETGTNFGCTTIVLAQAVIDARVAGEVHTIELQQDNWTVAQENLRHAGVDHLVTSWLGDSRERLPAILNGVNELAVVFLDASHLYEDVLFEFEAVLPKLRHNGVVLLDNTYRIAEPHEDQRVAGALEEIIRRHGGNLVNFDFVSWYTPGLAIWTRG